jgi:hypothetical protein
MVMSFKQIYNLIVANLILILINTVYHFFILVNFDFNICFHIEELLVNTVLIFLILYVRNKVNTFSNFWVGVSVLYFVLLLLVSLLDLCAPIVDIFRYVISGDSLYLQVDDGQLFYDFLTSFMNNILNYVHCGGEDSDRQIEPIHNSMTWSKNANGARRCLTGAGLGMTPVAFVTTVISPTTLAKLPLALKVGATTMSVAAGIGVEVVSHWH